MREQLINLLDKSYAPYSNFHVACIIETKDGKFVPGVNVENSSYGATICAERNAITTAVTMGYRQGDFKRIYIMVSGKKMSMPCFVCRQVIVEFFDKDSEIILMDKEGKTQKYLVSECCPYPFDATDL